MPLDTFCEGVTDGPVANEIFKRAVCRPAPSKFTVEMLGSAKKGSNAYYGMRIWPTLPITADKVSLTSGSPGFEYEVWRKWEDCLNFQGTLEVEYRRKARAKRQRLIKGKGVKKNGMYLQDQASSWESLPPGPDPNSVAKDIHHYLPPLTRKGTVFRTSQATIDQRAQEFARLIEALMRPDVPALVDEIRRDRVVSDFFAIWRRDVDLIEKDNKQKRAARERARSSVTSSLFSMYFPSNHSTPALSSDYASSITITPSHSSHSTQSTVRAPGNILPSISESIRTRKSSSDSSDGSPSICGRPRSHSTGSSNYSPSTMSDASLDSPEQSSVEIPEIREEIASFAFNYNPHSRQDSHCLSALPEDRETSWKEKEALRNPPPVTRRRGKSLNSEAASDRNGYVFLTPQAARYAPDNRLAPPERSVRESWQTVDSMACMLEGMDLTLSIPTNTGSHLHRSSMASVATFRTDCSAEGVLPRADFASLPVPPLPQQSMRQSPARSRYMSFPISVSEFDEEWPESPQESESGEVDDILDSFFADSFPESCSSVPQGVTHNYPTTPHFGDGQRTPNHSRMPPSPGTSSTFFAVTSDLPRLNIKVGCNDSFIAIRAPGDISYKDLRQRIYNKFVGVEGVPLSDKFKLSFVQRLTYSAADTPVDHDDYTLYPITSDGDWETVTAAIEGSKLTLRVTDKI